MYIYSNRHVNPKIAELYREITWNIAQILTYIPLTKLLLK